MAGWHRDGEPMNQRIRSMGGILMAGALGLIIGVAHADAGSMEVELNKLEAREGSCLAYLVFENHIGERLETFRLDLVMFDTEGIIAHRLAVEAGPLAADKTVVKMFDITDLPCEELGRVLLNEVMDCESADDTVMDCTARTRVSARTEIPFVK